MREEGEAFWITKHRESLKNIRNLIKREEKRTQLENLNQNLMFSNRK